MSCGGVVEPKVISSEEVPSVLGVGSGSLDTRAIVRRDRCFGGFVASEVWGKKKRDEKI